MLVEILGLPGSGKTSFLSKCEKDNKKAHCFYASEYRLHRIIRIRLLKLLFKLSPIFWRKKKIVLSIVSNKQVLFGKNNKTFDIEDAVFVSMLHDHLNKKKSIYIIDEGVLQRICFLACVYNIDDYEFKFLLFALFKEYSAIFIGCDISVALNRIQKRNRKKCEMDDLLPKELEKFLFLYDERIKKAAEIFNLKPVADFKDFSERFQHLYE